MNVFELPSYYEDDKLVAWRNSFMHRELRYPYVQYIIKARSGNFIIEARRNTDLLKFEEPLKELHEKGVRTFWDLTMHVVAHGKKGVLGSTYVLGLGRFVVAVDPVLDSNNLDFVFATGREELLLTAPAEARLWEPFWFLKRIWKNKDLGVWE